MNKREVGAVLRDFSQAERRRARAACKNRINGGKRFRRIERIELTDGTHCFVAVYSK